ncbi:MAG: hypothetical protein ACI8TX_001421 [Hyphomicrobiaceae bacterium]|jgi:hypothetical protein
MRKALAIFSFGLLVTVAQPVGADVRSANGWIYQAQEISDFVDGCVASGTGGAFVGVGPQNFSFPPPAGTRRILFVSESGTERVVATGMNSISDCVYDLANDVLFVVDNGGEFDDSATGDTVIALPGVSTASDLVASQFELLPAGSIPEGASIAFDQDGNLLVTTATGDGGGDVLRITLDGNAAITPFIVDAFDFTGGIALDVDGTLLVADSDSKTFKTRIRRFDTLGNEIEVFSGPTDKHGSFGLGVTPDGKVISTGSGTPAGLVRNSDRRVRRLTRGLGDPEAFGGALDVDQRTGRVTFLASTFTGDPIDRSIHTLTRIKELEPGVGVPGGSRTECLLEFYGVEFIEPVLNQRLDISECRDGDPCDADGVVNDVCVFPAGFCVGVKDSRFRRCAPLVIGSVELLSGGPDELAEAVARANAELPIEGGGRCFTSDGVSIPLKITKRGFRRTQTKRVRMRVLASPPSLRTDRDEMRLRCLPPELPAEM